MGLFRCRYQANQRSGNFCIGEIQREHCVFTFHDVGQINFRTVGIQQRQGTAVQQLGGHRDFYLALRLGELAGNFKADAQQRIAVRSFTHAQHQLAIGQMLALRRHFFNQRQMCAIAHIAAYGAERARRFILLEFDDGAFGLADVLAILALAGRAVRAVAVTRPFAIPVQQRLRLVILIAVIAFFAGVQRVAALSAGRLDDLFGIIVPGGGISTLVV